MRLAVFNDLHAIVVALLPARRKCQRVSYKTPAQSHFTGLRSQMENSLRMPRASPDGSRPSRAREATRMLPPRNACDDDRSCVRHICRAKSGTPTMTPVAQKARYIQSHRDIRPDIQLSAVRLCWITTRSRFALSRRSVAALTDLRRNN